MTNDDYERDAIIPQLLAQLEVHEILLSGLYANWIAGQSSEEFGQRLMDEVASTGNKLRDHLTADPVEIEFMVERQRYIREALERFSAKTLKRGREIREARGASPANDEG